MVSRGDENETKGIAYLSTHYTAKAGNGFEYVAKYDQSIRNRRTRAGFGGVG